MKLLPPKGCKIVTKGTTNSGDLVWNERDRTWEPVDSVNEYVSEYIAVARPAEPKAEPASPPKRKFSPADIIADLRAGSRDEDVLTDAANLIEETAMQRDELFAACVALLEISPKRESDRWDRAVTAAQEAIARCQPSQPSISTHDPDELIRSHSGLFRIARRFEAWIRAEITGETHDDQERLVALPDIAKAIGRGARFASDEDCQPSGRCCKNEDSR